MGRINTNTRDRDFLAMLKHRRRAHATLFRYQSGQSIAAKGGTFTNASANGVPSYIDSGGVVRFVNTNTLRDQHYIGGVRTTLIEGARTNQCLQSSDMTQAVWVKGASSALKNVTGPDAVASSACTLTEDGTNAAHSVSQGSLTITASATQPFSIFLKANGRTNCRVYLVNGADFVGVTVNLVAGTAVGFTGGAGVFNYAHITALANGWFRIEFSGRINVASTTATAQLDMAAVAGTYSYQGDGVSGMLIYGADQEKDGIFATSVIQTGAASVTRATDAFSLPYPITPRSLTLYAKFFNLGTFQTGSTNGVVAIGGAANQGLCIFNSGANAQVLHRTASDVTSSAAYPNQFDVVEHRGLMNPDGSVLFGQTLNAGAEAVGATSGANAILAAWVAATLFIGDRNGVAGFAAFQSVKILAGVQSLARCRAA